jgi:hypothetical protein
MQVEEDPLTVKVDHLKVVMFICARSSIFHNFLSICGELLSFI